MKKEFTETKKRRSTGQQPGTKSASHFAEKPRINRLSTGDIVLALGLNRISLVRASGKTFKRLAFDALKGTRDACFLGEMFSRRPAFLDRASLSRRLAVCLDSARPWYVRVRDSTCRFT